MDKQLIIKYLPLVRKIVKSKFPGISRNEDNYNEIFIDGVLGLFNGINNFPNSKTTLSLEFYLYYQIKLSIFHEWLKSTNRSVESWNFEKRYRNEFFKKKLSTKQMADLECVSIETCNRRILAIQINDAVPFFIDTEAFDNKNKSVEKQVEIKWVKKELQYCISKLTEKERKVIILTYFEKLKIIDGANILNIPKSTFEKILIRARKNLKKMLIIKGIQEGFLYKWKDNRRVGQDMKFNIQKGTFKKAGFLKHYINIVCSDNLAEEIDKEFKKAFDSKIFNLSLTATNKGQTDIYYCEFDFLKAERFNKVLGWLLELSILEFKEVMRK